MLYVLLILVVVLAIVCGAEYAMLRVAKAEYRADVAELRRSNLAIANKCKELTARNKDLAMRMVKMENIKEGQK